MLQIDSFIIAFDKGLRVLLNSNHGTRPMPGESLPEATFSNSDKQKIIALMRVNHSGEVCAQALYQGQSMTSRNPQLKKILKKASDEELDHLGWSAKRITDLGGRLSFLNPLWYIGSLSLGMLAGKLGDAWNLGFLAETEYQVERHLDRHLTYIPIQDKKTIAILEQMKKDEAEHAAMAKTLGARELPIMIKYGMKITSKFMTKISYII